MQESPNWYKDQVKKKRKSANADLSFLKPSNLFKAASSSSKKTEVKVETTVNDKIFDKSVLKIEPGSLDPMGDLENIIGLKNVRHEIEKLESTLEYKKERKERGIKDDTSNSLHMCFYGAPGTGKTTIARIMTGLLYQMGYIKENKCVEINGLDFKGAYVGQTEIITKGILDTSCGGVLFVDEAYALCNGPDDSYGREAINTFIKEMEDNRDKLIIIFAGYEKDMDEFLDQNSGFRSRINRYFKFENYTTIELGEILLNNLRRKHLKITPDCLTKCLITFKKAKKYHKFGNGRFCINLIEKIEEQHMLNVMGLVKYNPKQKTLDPEIEECQDTLTIADFPDNIIDELLKSIN
jgi:SpoVK/Ycf46/Vps4 family AAA+-type ATPase